ncbi:MAG TPA: hypothetical protein VK652_04240 [Steroidobacteraceae bacterium]|nr:hypothetical protein [Steroidobacteraceae bacterium]
MRESLAAQSDEMSESSMARRELLIAFGLCATAAPLFGCGGGSSPNASPSPSTGAQPSASLPSGVMPAVTFSDTQAAGLATYDAYLTDVSAANSLFSYTGAASALVTQLGPAFPRQKMVSADTSVSDTFSPGKVYATFYHTGKELDLIQYGFSDTVTLYINDAFAARYAGALASGTAQGGSISGITLSAASSNVSGYYNEYVVRIIGGTGVLNETRRITAYDAASFDAAVASPWTIVPDNTTQYVLQDGTQPFVLDGSTGSVKYIHLNWAQSGRRKITVEQGIFAGVASDGPIAPAPPWSETPLLVVGDSFWDGEAAPISIPRLINTFALSMGWLPTNLGEGGTGYIATTQNRLSFPDRIAPPAESWRVLRTATGGTYTIEVTLGGVTATCAALAFNAGPAAIQSALNLLSNVVAAEGSFAVARGDFSTPLIIVGHGVSGATLSLNTGNLTGGTLSILGRYLGDVAPNVPTDSGGNAQPFYLLVPGSGNDSRFSDVQVQAAATYVAQQIVARFPTAMPIFTGVFGDCNVQTSIVGTTDISRNAALAAAAAYLPKIAGKVPFIDTYSNGLGGLKIVNGRGTVANPEPGTNSKFKSIVTPGHPTGRGSQFMSDWLAARVKALIE